MNLNVAQVQFFVMQVIPQSCRSVVYMPGEVELLLYSQAAPDARVAGLIDSSCTVAFLAPPPLTVHKVRRRKKWRCGDRAGVYETCKT